MALRHHKIHPITAEQFEYLNLRPDWQIISVPEDNWRKIPNLPRINDTMAVYASGCPHTPQTFNDIEHVGACDIVAYEQYPQIEKGEISINICHCVFQKLKTSTDQYEYLMHYPFNSGSHLNDGAIQSILTTLNGFCRLPSFNVIWVSGKVYSWHGSIGESFCRRVRFRWFTA